MAKAKELTLVEQAQVILERARNAESSKDFDLLFSNISAIKSFLEEHKDSAFPINIQNPNDSILIQLNLSLLRLKTSIKVEQDRRKTIKNLGKDYDAAKKKLDEYDALYSLYKDLFATVDLSRFTYDPSTPPPDNSVSERALYNYFYQATKIFGIEEKFLSFTLPNRPN